MAIKLARILDTGFTGDYWKIIQTNINYLDKYSNIVMALFKDKVARDAGKSPITSVSYGWHGDDFPFSIAAMSVTNPVEISYKKIKASKIINGLETNEFANGVDV